MRILKLLIARTEAARAYLASPPDPMRILKQKVGAAVTVRFFTCITTRSDEDTETFDNPNDANSLDNLHHHPIR